MTLTFRSELIPIDKLVMSTQVRAMIDDAVVESYAERMRAGQLPDPLPIAGRPTWSRDVILTWLRGGCARRGRR